MAMSDDNDIIARIEDQILNRYLDSLDLCQRCGAEACEGDDYCDEHAEPDPDTMLGGHDNPYPDEGDDPRIGEDCFETAMWDAYPPSEPFDYWGDK